MLLKNQHFYVEKKKYFARNLTKVKAFFVLEIFNLNTSVFRKRRPISTHKFAFKTIKISQMPFSLNLKYLILFISDFQ